MTDDNLIPSVCNNPEEITTIRPLVTEVLATHEYNTILSVLDAISIASDFPFCLDMTQLEGRVLGARLKSKDYLPLVCTKHLIDGTQCAHNVLHTVGNILHAVKTPGHLRCQGQCDSKKKGKARRKNVDQAAEELAVSRGGTWTILPETYQVKGKKIQLVHVACGGVIHRKLCHVLDFPTRAGLLITTDADCPYCSGRSARPAMGEDPILYSAWLSTATGGRLAFRSGSLAPQDRETVPLEVECTVCKSVFSALESQLVFSDFCGCKQCAESQSHQQRAWILREAKQVVSRRGLVLEDNPQSYIASARIVTSRGEPTGYPNILSLVQALPASSKGFGQPAPEQLVWDTSNTGREYTVEEESIIRTAHQQHRSKTRLSHDLRRSLGSVTQKCKKLGLRFDAWDHVNRRIMVDDQFFSVLSARKAYWAGLLASDGCLSKDISIELKVVDEVVLQQFMAALGHSGSLTYRTMSNVGGRGLYAALRFSSKQIKTDLLNHYNLTPRKSLTLLPPNLQEGEHVLAYICGLFEGDGHLRISKRDGLICQLCTASLDLANWLQQQVIALIGVKGNFRHASTRGERLYELTWSGRCAERFLTALTEVVKGTMARKWEKFAAHLETSPKRRSER